jgi:hypothetical protein
MSDATLTLAKDRSYFNLTNNDPYVPKGVGLQFITISNPVWAVRFFFLPPLYFSFTHTVLSACAGSFLARRIELQYFGLLLRWYASFSVRFRWYS